MSSTLAPLHANGKLLKSQAGRVVFQPTGTTYEMHLDADGDAGVEGQRVDGVISIRARKLYTVPSGGLFIAPILGTPKTFQGRVREVGSGYVVITCPVPVRVELPKDDGAVEMARGGIAVGALVNVIAFAGATLEVTGRTATLAHAGDTNSPEQRSGQIH